VPPSDTTESHDKDNTIITIRNKDYLLYEGRILEDDEASAIFNYYSTLLG